MLLELTRIFCHEDSKTRRKISHEFTRMDTNFLDADCAGYAEKYSHEKAQKASAFAKATADRQRKINRELEGIFLVLTGYENGVKLSEQLWRGSVAWLVFGV